ncbi:MAG: AAA family ATPase, partial [Candidatus Micrarchaeota archaeon]
MRIIITGSPGTGKSSIAKMLSKRLSLELIDLK